MSKHPANNGKVMLSIWVDAPLRDYVRARALESGKTVSEWAGEALRQAVLHVSVQDVEAQLTVISSLVTAISKTEAPQGERIPWTGTIGRRCDRCGHTTTSPREYGAEFCACSEVAD